VRNLAQRSAGAAKEIKTLIDDSAEKTERGTRLVGQAGVTMDEVVASVRRVTDIMSEIASASQEQSAGIEQVNLSIIEMDSMTQQNAALVEEAAAAAQSLQDQASELTNVVSIFTLVEGEEKAAPTLAPPVAVKPAAKILAAAPSRVKPRSAPVRKTSRAPALASTVAGPKPVPAKATAPDDEWDEF
jgi:methyl-accepting chemotaxis protein